MKRRVRRGHVFRAVRLFIRFGVVIASLFTQRIYSGHSYCMRRVNGTSLTKSQSVYHPFWTDIRRANKCYQCAFVFADRVPVSIVFADLFLGAQTWHLVEADPRLSFLDVLQLLHNLLLGDAVALGNHPELGELLDGDLAVPVEVHLIKEFPSRQLPERALPVLQCLLTVYVSVAIVVEYCKGPLNFFQSGLTEFLKKQPWQRLVIDK